MDIALGRCTLCVCVCARVWYLKGGFADLQLELIKLLIFCQLSLDIEGYDNGITTLGLNRQHDNYCRYDSYVMFVEKLFERKAFLVNQLWIQGHWPIFACNFEAPLYQNCSCFSFICIHGV